MRCERGSIPAVCGAKKLQCPGTHHCIPHWELCDWHQDCEDGWDEEGCPLQPCLPGQWQCRNRVCIAAEWKCNGVDDCGDSSDEDVCGKWAHEMLLGGLRPARGGTCEVFFGCPGSQLPLGWWEPADTLWDLPTSQGPTASPVPS